MTNDIQKTPRSASLLYMYKKLAVAAGALAVSAAAFAEPAVVTGADFDGGAKKTFGGSKFGEQVNYVYAAPTGAAASMSATIAATPKQADAFLHLRGRDDDAAQDCPIRIELNSQTIYEGLSRFPSDRWAVKQFNIPSDFIQATNTLTIKNTASSGDAGNPPWFMVAGATIADSKYKFNADILRDFHVTLPAELREFPEPLPPGAKPGFAIRGTKGWLWKPEQYLAEIPYLPKCKMNFLMNCYGSMCDIENKSFGDPQCNRWYEPLPAEKKKKYEEVVEACKKQNITFCFSMNPNLSSSRFINTGKPEDIDALWQHYAWMQGLGVKWFNISLDDITQGIDASGQCNAVNEILKRLRAKDPEAQMIFCPTYYWGDGTDAKARPYLETVARELHKDIYLFWTGDSVVGQITRKGAETFKGIAQHRLILWDNYPVNDGHPTMHLGPVVKRDVDLCEVIDAYMGNPHASQNEINRIPMYTCADYAYNPQAYDPARSLGQAILHLEPNAAAQKLLSQVVELYPGMLIFNTPSTAFNGVREHYTRLTAAPHSKQVVRGFIDHVAATKKRMDEMFPERYAAERKTVAADVEWLTKSFADRYENR